MEWKAAVESCLVEPGSFVPSFVEVLDDASDSEMAVVFGSLRTCLSLSRKCRIPVEFDFRVSDWLPFASRFALNGNGGYFKQSFQLDESDIGMFCKSDSGCKVLSGMVIGGIEDVFFIRSVTLPQEMFFLSPRRDLCDEARVWMLDGRPVSFSGYGSRPAGERMRGEFFRFAESASLVFEPSEAYVIDVCRCGGEMLAVEYNGYPTAGFYSGDMGEIISSYADYFCLWKD